MRRETLGRCLEAPPSWREKENELSVAGRALQETGLKSWSLMGHLAPKHEVKGFWSIYYLVVPCVGTRVWV